MSLLRLALCLGFVAVLVVVLDPHTIQPLEDSGLLFYHPMRFQGSGEDTDYVEGWYFKMSDSSNETLVVIPGIFHGSTPDLSHAFTMVIYRDSTHYYRFPASSFSSVDGKLRISVGDNVFASTGLELNLVPQEGDEASLEVKGSITFGSLVPWPVSFLSPGASGPFWYLPLQCYQGVLSMDHTLFGEVDVVTYRGSGEEKVKEKEKETLQFEGGRGYAEKTWGTTFPESWIWFQSNHFDAKVPDSTSVTFSVASVPFYGLEFPGFVVALWYEEEFYRFTTYTGAKITLHDYNDTKVVISVADFSHRLHLLIDRTDLQAKPIWGPRKEGMVPFVREAIDASALVTFSSLSSVNSPEIIIFQSTARRGGLEVVGDTQWIQEHV